MDEETSILKLDDACDQAVAWLTWQLKQAGLQVIETFDLHSARQAHAACPCPYHGTQACDCQMVVLLIYSPGRQPLTIVAHGYNRQTWFSVVDTPQQRADPYIEAAFRRLAASQGFSFSSLEDCSEAV